MAKRSNGFDKNKARAAAAGKKSSRRLPEDLREARMHNANEFEACIYTYMNMPLAQLESAWLEPGMRSLDKIVIKILILSIKNGDYQRLNFLLERTIGKVADRLEFKDKTKPLDPGNFKNMSYDELSLKYFAYINSLREKKGG